MTYGKKMLHNAIRSTAEHCLALPQQGCVTSQRATVQGSMLSWCTISSAAFRSVLTYIFCHQAACLNVLSTFEAATFHTSVKDSAQCTNISDGREYASTDARGSSSRHLLCLCFVCLPYPLVLTVLTARTKDLNAFHVTISVCTVASATFATIADSRATANDRCGIKSFCGLHSPPNLLTTVIQVCVDASELSHRSVEKV